MHEPISTKTYLRVLVALGALTAVTVAVAFADLGRLNSVAALGIAVTKAMLVLLYFMDLRRSPGLTRLVVVAGVAWLLVLISISMIDVFTRDSILVGNL